MKLNITWVGQPKTINTKYGAKEKYSIKVAEYGDNYVDVWSSPTTKGWTVGQVVEVLSVDESEYNGKKQYSVKMPKIDNRPTTQAPSGEVTGKILLDLGHIHFKLDKIIKHLSGDSRLDLTSAGTPVPDFTPKTMNVAPDYFEVKGEDPNPEDIPF